jgi:hypothetical protein
MRFLSALVACVLLLASPSLGLGGPITIVGNLGDGTLDVNGHASGLSDPGIGIGSGGNDARGQQGILFFALPTVASPSAITSASFQIDYLGLQGFTVMVPPEFNVDLFSLGTRSSPTILPTDYYDGPASLSTDTLVTAGLVTPSTAVGRLTVTDGSLLSAIRALYNADGTPTADYAVFRISPDVDLPSGSGPLRRYNFASADDLAHQPELTLNVTAVPEPATLALAVIGVGGLLANRWRRRIARA